MKKLLPLLLILTIPSFTYSQIVITPGYMKLGPMASITLISGDVQVLKKIERVNIIYDYSEISVNEFRKEVDFLKKKEEEYKTNPEVAEEFKLNWFTSRNKYFEPIFEYCFNECGKKEKISGKNQASDKVITLKVSTLYVTTKESKEPDCILKSINLECVFLDENGSKLLSYLIKNVTGLGPWRDADLLPKYVFTTTYGKAAKLLVKEISKTKRKLNAGAE